MTAPSNADLQARLDHIQDLARSYLKYSPKLSPEDKIAFMLAAGVLAIAQYAVADPAATKPQFRAGDVIPNDPIVKAVYVAMFGAGTVPIAVRWNEAQAAADAAIEAWKATQEGDAS